MNNRHTSWPERQPAEQEVLHLPDASPSRANDKYLMLFNHMEQGFCIVEVIFNVHGEPTDYRFLETNPAFEKQTGLHDAVGKTMRALAPTHEEEWFRIYGTVAKTRQPVHFEKESTHLKRNVWYDVFAFPSGPAESNQVAILFNDITERKRHEQRQAFLLALSDVLRPLADAVEIQQTVAHIALAGFGVDRCYYCEIAEGKAVIRRDAARAGLPSVIGVYPLADFPLLQAVIAAGQPFVVADAHNTDILDEPLRQLCLQLQVISFIDVPIIKHGRAIGVLCITQSTPRQWTPFDVELAVETAERTWSAVERARAEAQLRESQERLRLALDATEMGTFLYHVAGDRGEPDARMLALFGLPPDGTLNLAEALMHLIHPADRDRYAAAVARATDPAGDGMLHSEIRVLHPDGVVRWVAVTAQVLFDGQPRGATRMYGVAADITERKRREAHQNLLVEIDGDLARLFTPDEIMQTVGARLGAYLNLGICVFVDVDEARDEVTVHHGWNQESVTSLEHQTFRMSDYTTEEFRRASRAGETFVIRDTANDERVDGEANARLNVGAWLGLPFHREGRWTAFLSVTATAPRDWRDDEI
ncbi:MAG: GAF domain-containing protein, partial [Caldilineaceae bacterium]|nr:GAF domain-containing protein [Caldilineaceae bacterium]